MRNLERKISKILILIFTGFIGIGAFFGSISMFIDPTGGLLQMESLLPYFEKMPFYKIFFQDYIFSGIALLIINGLTNISAFVLILMNKKIGYFLGFIFGITLMLWIALQFILFLPNVYTIDIVYMIFGFFQMIFGWWAYARFSQSQFSFSEDDYKNYEYEITNNLEIVIYFSRTDYTKKLAYEFAKENKCLIKEIKTPEKISGNLGFWWCGRFGMHHWPMDIIDLNLDLSKYNKVHLFTPIWVFRISSPMRKFIILNKDNLSNISLTIVHFMHNRLNRAFLEVEGLLMNSKIDKYSVQSHFGKYQKR